MEKESPDVMKDIPPLPKTTLEDLIGKKFLKKKSTLSDKDKETRFITEDCDLTEFATCKFVLLFFSAGWCYPCHDFLQVLKDFYSEVNIDQKVIEVIYVTDDHNDQDFKDNYAKMPWLTFPYSSPMHENLKKRFEIIGVPMVLVLDAETGFLITKKGRKDIFDIGVNCLRNWREDMPNAMKKEAFLRHGKTIVDARLAEEARKKKEEEDRLKENE